MITPELKSVILTSLKLDDWDIDEHTVADQVPGWDSLTHINVILAVEQHFGVHFKSRDVLGMKSVGDLERLVTSKQQEKRPL
jgi:acyl carrier protein